MESVLYNDYRQEPITSDEVCGYYRHYLAQLEALVADQEDVVAQVRAKADLVALATARSSLWRLLTKRQGVVDALAVYERQYAQTR